MPLITREEELGAIRDLVEVTRDRREMVKAVPKTFLAARRSQAREAEGKGQAGLFGDDASAWEIPAPPDEAPWSAADFADAIVLLTDERELVHMYLSGHPLILYGPLLRRHDAVSPDEVEIDPAGSQWQVVVGGTVAGLRERRAREPRPGRPDTFAFFGLEGWVRTLRCVAWSQAWEQMRGRRPKDGDFVAAFGYAEHDRKNAGEALFVCHDVLVLTAEAAAEAAIHDLNNGGINGDAGEHLVGPGPGPGVALPSQEAADRPDGGRVDQGQASAAGPGA